MTTPPTNNPARDDGAAGSESTPAAAPLVPYSPEQLYQLHRLQVLSEVKGELLLWGRRRFWVVAAIASAIGLFGLPTILRDLARDELRTAMQAGANAEAAATNARSAAESAKKQIDDLRASAESVNRQFGELKAAIDATSGNVREEARLSIGQLQAEVMTLQDVVKQLAERTLSPKQAQEFADTLALLRRAAKEANQEFVDNSLYRVEMMSVANGSFAPILEALRQAGFKTADYLLEASVVERRIGRVWGISVQVWRDARGPLVIYRASARKKADVVRNLIDQSSGAAPSTLVETQTIPNDIIGVFVGGH